MKHWEERLDTDTHIFLRESILSDWSAYGAIQSVGRRETWKGPAIPDLKQPTFFVTQGAFFALGMGCRSPDIALKYPMCRHLLPDPPSWTPEEYKTTGYRLVQDILPPDLMDQLCALQFEREEHWDDILQGHNQGGWRRQTALGTVNKRLPSTQVAFAAHFSRPLPGAGGPGGQGAPSGRTEGGGWMGYQWPHRDFMLTLRGAADTRGVFISCRMIRRKSLCRLHRK